MKRKIFFMMIKKNYTRFFPIIIFFIFDLIVLFRLFFPTLKLIVTPEFYGGDSTVVYFPYKYFDCQKVKTWSSPFWSRNTALGYPLYAEGETGYYNPINLVTCLIFDYKTAFNLQIFIYILIAQIGMYILLTTIGLSNVAAIFGSVIFPFLPIYVMNYMQIVMIYPVYIIPYLLAAVWRLTKRGSFRNYLFLTLAVFSQFIISHFQIFFMTPVLIALIMTYLMLRNKIIHRTKTIFLIVMAYFTGVMLAGFQLLPMLEFFIQSNRLNNNGMPIAVVYDQNLGFRNLLTLLTPYFFGEPQNGTYQFAFQAHPWEAVFNIYRLPLVFFLFVIIRFRELLKKNGAVFLAVGLIALLLALGRNSPLYFVHYLPLFSSFRFPSRYVLIVVFILMIIAAYGCDQFFKIVQKRQSKQLFIGVIFAIALIEIYHFFYSFHVLLPAEQAFRPPAVIQSLDRSKPMNIISSLADVSWMDNIYQNVGYRKQPEFFYTFANELMLGNLGLIYNQPTINNKSGPQLKRMAYYYTYLYDERINTRTKTASYSAQAKNLLSLSGIDYLLTSFRYSNDFLDLVKTVPNRQYGFNINLYQNKASRSFVQFYNKAYLIQTMAEFEKQISNPDLDKKGYALVENEEILNKLNPVNSPLASSYRINRYADDDLSLQTTTNTQSLLVYTNNNYPGWHAFIDGKETPIITVNFVNQGVLLPAGKHQVEIKYIPTIFHYGLVISIITGLMVFCFWLLFLRKSS